MTIKQSEAERADWLLTPQAIRTQAQKLFDLGVKGELDHFHVHLDRLDETADFVLATMRLNYPSLTVPPHARWRHFVIAGQDRWQPLAVQLDCDPKEKARIQCELAMTSVLLDAGAGPDWRYHDSLTSKKIARSEGLALASLDMFAKGAFSSDPTHPFQVDIQGLLSVTSEKLAECFQVRSGNPLEGLDGRASLIRSVGEAVSAMPDIFKGGRLGGLADYLVAQADQNRLRADTILITVLHAMGSIWPGRPTLAGRNLGDTWSHSKLDGDQLIPFHKLSQWLTYSLFEPLQALGLDIIAQNTLTGLAEYRNGGLFLDMGVLTLKDPDAASIAHNPGSDLVVEWRALTVILLDHIAERVRQKCDLDETRLPLASVLEGGTWVAGRRVAREKRSDGSPPLTIISDGSVF